MSRNTVCMGVKYFNFKLTSSQRSADNDIWQGLRTDGNRRKLGAQHAVRL